MDSAHSSGMSGSAEASSNFENNQNSGNSSDQPGKDDTKQNEESSRFECNICLDIAKDAVISMCGHLFCWPCLHQWIDTRPNRPLCPVCKSSISKDKVIPLYGRGGKDTDPREKCPPRPRGQRTEDPSQGFPGGFNWGGENGHGGVQFSLGIGVFPISFFASFFNGVGIGGGGGTMGADRRAEPPSTGSRQHSEEQFLSNVFMYIGILFVLWLVFF